MLSNHPILCRSLNYTCNDSLVHSDIGGERADETDIEATGGRSPRGGGSMAGRARHPPNSYEFPLDVPHTSVRNSSQGRRVSNLLLGRQEVSLQKGPGVDERLHQTAGWRGLGRRELSRAGIKAGAPTSWVLGSPTNLSKGFLCLYSLS